MATKEQDVAAVKALRPDGMCYVGWSEEGGGEVHRIWDTLILFSIPQYGGEGTFERVFKLDEAERLVDVVHSWT